MSLCQCVEMFTKQLHNHMSSFRLQAKKGATVEITPEGEIAKMDKLLALVREPDAAKAN